MESKLSLSQISIYAKVFVVMVGNSLAFQKFKALFNGIKSNKVNEPKTQSSQAHGEHMCYNEGPTQLDLEVKERDNPVAGKGQLGFL